MSFLNVSQISHKYDRAESSTFTEVSLELPAQGVLAVVGPSGEGKSTLLRCLAGFESLLSGRIDLDEKTLVGPGVFLPPEKRDIGIVPQAFCLFPHLSVEENIAFGLFRLGKNERAHRVQELIELTRLQDCRKALPCDISGGQQQRVALARALAPRPKLILMDEPFANLDDHLKQDVQDSLIETFQHNKVTCVLVTHSQDDVEKLATQVLQFSNSK